MKLIKLIKYKIIKALKILVIFNKIKIVKIRITKK